MSGATRLGGLLDELRAALEDERGLLLSGTPEQINHIAQRKMTLADAIERESAALDHTVPAADVLAKLARYNRENAVICATILRHMTAALDKLRQRDVHRSYGADGTEVSPPGQRPLGAA
jgi:flagellar biosynthesis/type III secretory pathway chaperone